MHPDRLEPAGPGEAPGDGALGGAAAAAAFLGAVAGRAGPSEPALVRGPLRAAESQPAGSDSGRGRACGGGGGAGQRCGYGEPARGRGPGAPGGQSSPRRPGAPGLGCGVSRGRPRRRVEIVGGGPGAEIVVRGGVFPRHLPKAPTVSQSSLPSVKSGKSASGVYPGEVSCGHPRLPCWTCLVSVSFRGSF